eukprot:UN17079
MFFGIFFFTKFGNFVVLKFLVFFYYFSNKEFCFLFLLFSYIMIGLFVRFSIEQH